MATLDLGHNLLTQEAQSNPFLLNGEEVPIITTYNYLGLWVTRDFDLAHMGAQRLETGKNSLLGLRAFLGYQRLPMHLWVASIRAILIPQLLYCVALWGTNKNHTGAAQKVVNEALRLVVGARSSDTTAHLAGLLSECNVPLLGCIAKGKVCRGIIKTGALRTYTKALMAMSPGKLKTSKLDTTWAYMAGSLLTEKVPHLAERWKQNMDELRGLKGPTNIMHRFDLHCLMSLNDFFDNLAVAYVALEEDVGPPKTVGRMVETLFWQLDMWERSGKLPAGRVAEYLSSGFPLAGTSRQCDNQDPLHAKGAAALARLRMNCFWVGRDLAKRGLWSELYASRCACCGGNEGETRARLVLHYAVFSKKRQEIKDLIRLARSISWEGADDAAILTMVLGGAVRAPSGDVRSVGRFSSRYLKPLLAFLNNVTRLRSKLLSVNHLQPNEA
jgi:hypothetical protein